MIHVNMPHFLAMSLTTPTVADTRGRGGGGSASLSPPPIILIEQVEQGTTPMYKHIKLFSHYNN